MCLPLLIPLSTFPPGHLAGGPLDARWLILLAVVGALAMWRGWLVFRDRISTRTNQDRIE
jgi:hypothetical protein